MSSRKHRRDSAALYGLPFKSIFGDDNDTVEERDVTTSTSTVSTKRRKLSTPGRPLIQKPSQILAHSNMPDPKIHVGTPTEFLYDLFYAMHGTKLIVKKGSDLVSDFFQAVTEDQIAAYTTEMVKIVRENNIERLRQVYQEDESKVHCRNQFGESLLHRACRLGLRDITLFLLEEAGLPTRISDDCGRNPMHDVCWNPSPQLEICAFLMQRDPALLLVADQRGFSPFEYARAEHWPEWKQFLFDHRFYLDKLAQDTGTLSQFTSDKFVSRETSATSGGTTEAKNSS